MGEVQAELLGGAPAPGDGIVGQVIDRFVGVEAALRGKELSRDSLCLVRILRRVARPVGTEPTPSRGDATATTTEAATASVTRRRLRVWAIRRRRPAAAAWVSTAWRWPPPAEGSGDCGRCRLGGLSSRTIQCSDQGGKLVCDLGFGQVDEVAEHQHLPLSIRQCSQQPRNRAAVVRLEAVAGRLLVRASTFVAAPQPATPKLAPGAVQDTGTHVPVGLGRVPDGRPTPVQAGEGIHHHVLGCLTVVDQQPGHPHQARVVLLEQRSHSARAIPRQHLPRDFGLGR